MEVVSVIFSLLALVISGLTAWLTLFQRGTIKMTRPTLVFFGPDGLEGDPKIYLRALLYSTSKRGRIIENMFLRLRRGESVQNFNVWVYGTNDALARGSGLFVGEDGVTHDYHFLLPQDGTQFQFLAGDYTIEIYASLIGRKQPLSLYTLHLIVDREKADALKVEGTGLWFDWGPDLGRYHPHVRKHPNLPATEIPPA